MPHGAIRAVGLKREAVDSAIVLLRNTLRANPAQCHLRETQNAKSQTPKAKPNPQDSTPNAKLNTHGRKVEGMWYR
jgi:hypothetical protein